MTDREPRREGPAAARGRSAQGMRQAIVRAAVQAAHLSPHWSSLRMAKRRRKLRKGRGLRFLVGAVILLAIAAVLAFIVWPEDSASSPDGRTRFRRHRRHEGPLSAALFVTCNLGGRLVPCGCEEGQLGGVARAATVYNRWADDHADRIIVDAGNATNATHPAADTVNRFVFEALDQLGCAVVNCGTNEVTLAPEKLAALARDRSFALICANLVGGQTGETILPPYHVVERGSLHVGFLGLVDDDIDPLRMPDGRKVITPEDALTRELPALRAQADLIVVLGYLPPDRLYQLAQKHPDVDLFLGGRTTVSSDPFGEIVERTAVAYLGDEGCSVGLLEFNAEQNQPPQVQATAVRLDPKIPDDPKLADLVARFGAALGDQPRPGADWDARMPCTGSYVGSEVCLLCHRKEYYAWLAGAHAGAYVTLLQAKHSRDPNCLGCHTTGHGQPGGYAPDRVQPLLARLIAADDEERNAAAAELVRDIHPLKSVPELILRLNHKSGALRGAAHDCLKRIAATRVAGAPEAPEDYDPKAPQEKRDPAVENWNSWWATHKARLESPLDRQRRNLEQQERRREDERRRDTRANYPLVGVGCECCHGGGRRHLGQALRHRGDPAAVRFIPHLRPRAAARNCTACHNNDRLCLRQNKQDPYHELVKCPRCKGKGRINPKICETCKGTGTVVGVTCEDCDGVGRVYADPCPRCGGKGKIPNRELYMERIQHWPGPAPKAPTPPKAPTTATPPAR